MMTKRVIQLRSNSLSSTLSKRLLFQSQRLRFLSGSSTPFHRSPVTAPPLRQRRNSPLVPLAIAKDDPADIDGSHAIVDRLGFEKISEQIIDGRKSTAVLYKHKKTGAEIMSVSNDDENKVFGIVFRTPPKDSTGIAHIVEHSVLRGSRKYPLKDPFVELLKGSLSSFQSAYTFSDRTCYPVASTITKEFYILVDVYLDAVFYPRCVDNLQTFQEEGWHYELNHPTQEISLKGIVLNEMKGRYSQPDNLLLRISKQALFPDNTYGVDSGGNPKDIPKLTFEEFKEFHHKYYQPSNARIWFYGDDDPIKRLHILSAYLNNFEASPLPKESKVELQKLFKEPVRIVEKYPAGEDGNLKKKHMVCLSWLLSDEPLNLETELALHLLDDLLFTSASPLAKTLLESGLGEDIIHEMDHELLQPYFSIGLKNVYEADIHKIEELIMKTLQDLVEEGFSTEAVEASVNTMEFYLRENETRSLPRGVLLMFRSIRKWIYDMDPFDPLRFEEPLLALKERISGEGSKAVFSPLMVKLILNNPHRVTVEMQPDPDKMSRDEAAEREDLEKFKSSMTEEGLAELARATQDLLLKQQTLDPPEVLKTVPNLSLRDISRKPTYVPTDVGEINGVKVLQHDLFTNDFVYSELAFDMSSLRKELFQLVPLFYQSLLKMGTKDMDYVQLDQLIRRKTGGISVRYLRSSVRGKVDPCTHMIVRGKALAGRIEDLFNLMTCIIQDAQFTEKQPFKQFVSQSKARMESQLTVSGHSIATSRMNAKLNVAGWISEQMEGISYLEFLQDLEKKIDDNWEEISSSLEEIRTSLFSRKGCLVNMTADEKNLSKSMKHLSRFLDSLPETPSTEAVSWHRQLSPLNEAIVMPTKVSYVGKAANIYESGYELNGSAYVISNYIENTWVWDNVRLKGGAYGGFVDFDSDSGVFSFVSHRDPNLLKTLKAYDGTANFLREFELDDDSLTKAIIGAIGVVDPYQLPDAKGYSSLLQYLLGQTQEERERRHEEILSTTKRDFKEFANVVDAVKEKGVVVVVASPENVAAANRERSDLFHVKKVL